MKRRKAQEIPNTNLKNAPARANAAPAYPPILQNPPDMLCCCCSNAFVVLFMRNSENFLRCCINNLGPECLH